MDPYEAAFSPASPPPLLEDIDGVSSTLAEEAGRSSTVDTVATPSSSCSSSGGSVPIVSSTTEAGESKTTRDPRRMKRASSQPWMYYTCPKKCGFNSRNKDRFENHLKNCGSATTKKVEMNQYAPRADAAFIPSKTDKSVAARTTLEPSKILTCPKCGYKSPKKARMDIHNCQPVTQLKAQDVDSVLEKVAAKKELTKQPKSSKSTHQKAMSPVPEVASKKKELAHQPKLSESTNVEFPRLKCSLCGFYTTDRKFLANHEKLHVVKSQFPCPHCTYSVGNQGHLARHTTRDHPEIRKPNGVPQLPNVEPSEEPSLQTLNKELPKEMKERNIPKPQRKLLPKLSLPLQECAPKKRATLKNNLPDKEVSMEPFNGFQPLNKELSQEPKEGGENSQNFPTEKVPKEQKEIPKSKKSGADEKGKEISPRRSSQDSAPKEALMEVESPKKRSRPLNGTEKDCALKESSMESPKKKRQPGRPSIGTKMVYQCPQCDFSTDHYATNNIHEVTHKRKGAFKCELCTYSAARQYHVDTHVERYHRNASKVVKRAADPPKEKKKSIKPLVMIPMDQLQDLGAAADDEAEELPDLAFDYFQRLEDAFKTFSEGPITIADLQDLVEQTKEKAAELDDAEVQFVEDIALVASALYETYLSMEEECESVFIHDEKLESLQIELEDMQYRVRMASKEIRKLSNQQDSIQNKITQLGGDKVKVEMVVNRLEYDALQLKLNAKQSARAQRAYQDAQDQVRRSKDRVRSLDKELVKAEEEAGLLAAELEEVEEENGRDMKSLMMLKKEVEELEMVAATGQGSAESSKRMKELHETAVNQRRALCVLHDRLLKLTYIKMMELVDAEEKQWLEMLDKF